MFKVRQVGGILAVPIIIALATLIIVPWCRGIEAKLADLQTMSHQFDLRMAEFERYPPTLVRVEQRQQEINVRVTKLEDFAATGPRFTSKDAEALKNEILLIVNERNTEAMERLMAKIENIVTSINELKVAMAIRAAKEPL
jgi:hypothetical protein